jgi:hypothetical protein
MNAIKDLDEEVQQAVAAELAKAKKSLPWWAYVILAGSLGGSGGILATGEKFCKSLYGEQLEMHYQSPEYQRQSK